MTKETKHWTERSVNDFLYRIGADFVRQIEKVMEETGTTNVALAEKLGVSASRVSQVLNNPGNLTLRAVIRFARAFGHKVSVVTYDDGDPQNETGPVRAEIFASCWESAGRPSDYFQTSESQVSTNEPFIIIVTRNRMDEQAPVFHFEPRQGSNQCGQDGVARRLYPGGGLHDFASTGYAVPSIPLRDELPVVN